MKQFLLTISLLAWTPWLHAEQDALNFSEHVAPIIFQNCTSCHRPGEAGPFSLQNYNDVRKRGKLIARVTEDRLMPPWHAQKGAFPFHGDRRLTEAQIEIISRWFESGMAKGDPAKLPALPRFTEGWQLGKPDRVVEMTEPYPVPAEGRDIYRSFVVPLNLPEGKWLKAVEFRPGARSVVHHCLFFYDTTGEARRLDRMDPRPGFRRMRQQGRGIGPLGGWAVGGQPEKLPDDLAYYLPKNADLVLSMHYHPSGKPEQDRSSVGLYFTDQAPSTSFTGVQLPPAFGALNRISIPAGEPAYTVTDEFTLPIDVEAFAVSAHAHYLGKQLRMTATLPGGKTLDLLNIPDWDFSWQEQYQFEEFVRLPRGTKLASTVIWDNSKENPNNPNIPPRRVHWGPESEDEMGSLTLLVRPAKGQNIGTLNSLYRQHVGQVARNPRPATLANPANAPAGNPRGNLLLQGLMRRSDKNGNGRIDRGEEPNWLKPRFEHIDLNQDNALDEAEMLKALERLRNRNR